jgi:hypothetical protein
MIQAFAKHFCKCATHYHHISEQSLGGKQQREGQQQHFTVMKCAHGMALKGVYSPCVRKETCDTVCL